MAPTPIFHSNKLAPRANREWTPEESERVGNALIGIIVGLVVVCLLGCLIKKHTPKVQRRIKARKAAREQRKLAEKGGSNTDYPMTGIIVEPAKAHVAQHTTGPDVDRITQTFTPEYLKKTTAVIHPVF